MNILENILFDAYGDARKSPVIFIVGSPRTGSTFLYQLVINFFDCCYFSNNVNEKFSNNPVIGVVLEPEKRNLVKYQSVGGKVKGKFEPSEASGIFKNWFGGDHPSQIKSCNVIPKKMDHMTKTINTICNITQKPLVTKNAWNCFRIEDLSKVFPDAYFIWIRRNIILSALSDLKTKGNNKNIWNSATTTNYKEIMKMQYWEQVVEQQNEYNIAMSRSFEHLERNKWIEIWYEEICEDLLRVLKRISNFLGRKVTDVPIPYIECHKKPMDRDHKRIIDYVKRRGYESKYSNVASQQE